jgi:hypothetical protein
MVFVVRSRSKYGNEKMTVDGFTFDSKREANRYEELRMKQRAGLICDLKVHPTYDLDVNGKHVCSYEADFSYVEADGGSPVRIVEDVKGVRTRDYLIKKRLMDAVHGIAILET